MTALAVHQVVESLHLAGLKLALTPERALKVTPASRLTNELRTLIRGNKAVLVDWLQAANDPAPEHLTNSTSPTDWRALDAAYLAHHFNCQTCIAAGRDSQYGQRCGAGTALWALYSAVAAHPAEHLSIQKLGAHS